MRKTKIICTMGPSCNTYDKVKALTEAGMNVARLNFSHGTHESHKTQMDIIKQVRDDLSSPLAIMLDTKGPEYRIKTFKDGKIELKEGDSFTFTADEIEGDKKRVSVNYKDLPDELTAGDTILLNDGLLEFVVEKTEGKDIKCKCLGNGTLSDRKSMSFPGKVFKQIYLSENDKSDLKFGVENDIDFVACSFVSCKQDVKDVRDYLDSLGGNNIEIIAKIENQSGVDNLEEICEVANGIMVARGDMGVEIPYERLPEIQKRIIKTCMYLGKRSVTATEMLESMIHKPRPTRAEISDVANAVFDGSSAIMLSGETAAGDFPVEAVKAMAKIAENAEKAIDYVKKFKRRTYEIESVEEAMAHATCDVAVEIKASAIAVCTWSGKTAKEISRYRLPIDIIGITPSEKTYRSMSLSWGITPVLTEVSKSAEAMFEKARNTTNDILKLPKGSQIVISGGVMSDEDSDFNIMSVETL